MLEKSLDQFTSLAASSQPVPGGGGVTALVGSLAASLSEMVTNLTIGKKKYAQYQQELLQIRDQAESLRISLLEGINDDARAFEPLSRAYGMDKDSEGYQQKLEMCLHEAARPPFEILKRCTEVIELDERLAQIGSKLAVSDAATSVMLAHGALYGALINVKVNTRLMKDRDYALQLEQQAQQLVDQYAPRALACYDAVEKRLTNG